MTDRSITVTFSMPEPDMDALASCSCDWQCGESFELENFATGEISEAMVEAGELWVRDNMDGFFSRNHDIGAEQEAALIAGQPCARAILS